MKKKEMLMKVRKQETEELQIMTSKNQIELEVEEDFF